MLLVGTADGLLDLALDGTAERAALEGADVVAAVDGWAIADDAVISLDTGNTADLPADLTPRCLLALDGGRALVGTSDARLLVVGGPEGTREDALFDDIPSRKDWSTPWGGPPDTRSLAFDGDSGPYVGVHVGGVWRRDPEKWVEIVPAGADDHQVICAGDTVVVAAGIGVGQSDDRGDSWHWSDDGLHGRYSRAVAVADDWLLAGASTGPGTTEAALYRRPLGEPETPFARCGAAPGEVGALPGSFAHNIDTFELAAAGPLVALGTPTGELYLSEDAGGTWRRIAEALPGVHCVTFVS
jgi:hypothetical protein